MENTKGARAFDMLSPLCDTFELFIASPSANRSAPWWSPCGLYRILQTLRYMTLHYPIDPAKVFLAGISDGAAGCYAAANLICKPFAGFFAISGFGGLLPSAGIPLIPQNLSQRPIYNVNAGKDRLYPAAEVEKFLSYLKSHGVNVISSFHPHEEHGFGYRDLELGQLATFIRTWSAPLKPQGVAWTFVPRLPACADNIVAWISGENLAQLPQINCFWDRDTLIVRSNGIAGITLAFERVSTASRAYIRVNGAAPHRISPRAITIKSKMALMQYMEFPCRVSDIQIYTLDLQCN